MNICQGKAKRVDHKNLALSFMILIIFCLSHPVFSLSKINSQENPEDNEKAEILDKKALACIENRKYLEAMELFSEALDLKIENGLEKSIGDSYKNIANLFEILNDNESALIYIDKAIMKYKVSDQDIKLASALTQSGIMYQKTKHYTKAIDQLNKALEIYDEYDDANGIAGCNAQLGICYKAIEDYKMAEIFFNKALKTFEKNNNISSLADTYNYLAELYIESDKYTLASNYLKKSIQLHEETADDIGIAIAEKNMGVLQKNNGNLSSSNIYLSRALKTFRNKKLFEPIVLSCKELIDVHLRERNYNNVIRYNSLFLSYTDSIIDTQKEKNYKVQQLYKLIHTDELEKVLDKKNSDIRKLQRDRSQKQYVFYSSVILTIILSVLFIIIFFKNRKKSAELKLLKEKTNEIEKKFEARSREMQEKINEKILAEQTSDMLNNVLEQIEESVIITNLEKKIIYVNKHFENITGFTKSEVKDKIPDFLGSGELPEKILSGLSPNDSWKGNLATKLRDGNVIHEKAIIFPIRNNENKLKYYAAIKRDISESIIYDEVIEKSEAIMNSMLVHNRNSIFLLDPQESILIFNSKAKELCKNLFGDTLTENDTILKYIPQDELKNFKQKFNKVLQGESVICEKSMKGLENKEYNLSIKLDPVETEDRKVVGVLLSVYYNAENKIK